MIIQFLDNDTKEVIFRKSNVLQVEAKPTKQVTKFKVEDGSDRNHHIVEKANEVSVSFILTDVDYMENINAYKELLEYHNDNKLVTLQTRLNIYENMVIETIPHSEDKEIFYGGVVNMTLSEWREVTPEYGELKQEQVKHPKNSDTKTTGRQQGTETKDPNETKKSESILRGWTK